MLNNGLSLSVAAGSQQKSMWRKHSINKWLNIVLATALLMISVAVPEADSSSWYSGTPLLTARDQFTGGIINGKIYVFGGNGDPNGFNLKSTEVFDPATNQWSYVANNEHNGGNGVEELTGAVVNNKLYVFGGYGGGNPYGVFNFVEEYNPATNTWTSKAPMPTTRSSATAVAYNGEIYVFGGSLPSDQRTSVVEAYNPTSNTWRTVTNIPVSNLQGYAISVIGSKAFIIGGHNGSIMVNTVMTYDFATNIWKTTGYAPLPTPRVFPYAAAAPVINGKIFLIGGIIGNQQSYSECSVVEVYDTISNTWSTDTSLPTPLASQLSLALSGTIYAVGGDIAHTESDSIRTNAVWKREILNKGDLNGDGYVDLTDVILALRVLSGMSVPGVLAGYPSSGADVNRDGKLGIEEVIYILQELSNLRPPVSGIAGWWDLYVPSVQANKVNAFYLQQSGSDIVGTDILNQPVTGSITGTSVALTSTAGDTFNGTLSGNTITGTYFKPGYGSAAANFTRSVFHFTNFYPGEALDSPAPLFSWTPGAGAEKYYIRVMRDNAQHNCHEVGGCAGVWEKDGITDTGVVFNVDGTALESLIPGNNYRVRLFSRTNSQTGSPDAAGTYLDTTMDVAFKVKSVAFVSGDLQGTWHYKGIVSGDTSAGQLPGWLYGSMMFDSSGNTTFTPIVDSAGTAPYTPTAGTASIDPTGIITPTLNNTGRWIMTQNKNMMVSVGTGALGAATGVRGYNLSFFIKAGNNFTSADLEGSWNIHMLASGNSTAYIGWMYGSGTCDINGQLLWNSVTRSDGNSSLPGAVSMSINSNGIVTSSITPTFHGVMSQDKNAIVGTMNDGGGGYGLIIFTKAGGSYSLADLQGTWNVNGVVSGAASQWQGWYSMNITSDSSGNGNIGSYVASPGGTLGVSSLTWTVSPTGVVMFGGGANFHGAMSSDKNMIVGTMNDGGGGYSLIICSKAAPSETAPAVASDYVGIWKGTLYFSSPDGESGSMAATMTLSNNSGTLTGTVGTDSIGGTVTNGIFNFVIPNSDPSHPDCANWNMPATTILDSSMHTMTLYSSGTVCGSGGGKSGTLTGTLTKQ